MRSLALPLSAVVLSSMALGMLFASSACVIRPVHDPSDYDPNRAFHYGALQFEEGREAFMLTEQSIEREEKTWPFVLDSDLSDAQEFCVEVGAISGHVERCTTMGQLRAWLRK
jgi:hypothetical protein